MTLVNLTRDAAARLPDGVGTRADIQIQKLLKKLAESLTYKLNSKIRQERS